LKGKPHEDGFIFENLPQGLGITVISATKLADETIKFANTKTELSNKKVDLSDYVITSSEKFIQFVEGLSV